MCTGLCRGRRCQLCPSGDRLWHQCRRWRQLDAEWFSNDYLDNFCRSYSRKSFREKLWGHTLSFDICSKDWVTETLSRTNNDPEHFSGLFLCSNWALRIRTILVRKFLSLLTLISSTESKQIYYAIYPFIPSISNWLFLQVYNSLYF